tara:strand:- start:22707 stop:23159 length:453 start_codon:yes stop_codon:yes gene_type:complete
MIKKIKDLLASISKEEKIDDTSDLASLNEACAALLVEIAFADKEFNTKEKQSLKESLIESYNLEEKDIEDIIRDAEKTVEDSTSLYEYTRKVNDEFGYNKKLTLLENLWKVAYADNILDKYEEHLIRKISDLIHISHSDYINIKLKVRDD